LSIFKYTWIISYLLTLLLLCILSDHETANNAYGQGSINNVRIADCSHVIIAFRFSFSKLFSPPTYANLSLNQTGAENHQPVCPVDENANATTKDIAGCDRNEGPVDVRFTNAAQAYFEWMPIRRGPGGMGVVNIGSMTKVIEWGRLATVAVVDTRISYRSRVPTLNSCKYLVDVSSVPKV
jgi:hypothetical protein